MWVVVMESTWVSIPRFSSLRLTGEPSLFFEEAARETDVVNSSENLVKFALRYQSHTALVADNLCLPHPPSFFDFAISIAVIHHLSTPARRIEAIAAILETLRPSTVPKTSDAVDHQTGGRALIYVWALEQKHSRRGWGEGDEQDIMVPWVMKQKTEDDINAEKKTFNRYYHLYRRGELEHDIVTAGGVVLDSGYEKDNWWAITVRMP